jgi:hypothetical protein
MSQAVSAIPAGSSCAGCGESMSGEFCAACGQRAWRGRFTMRSLFTKLVADAFDLNRGLPYTVRQLSTRPGAMIREYVAGRTAPYTNPVKYFLIVGAITTLAFVRAGIVGKLAGSVATGLQYGPGLHPDAASVVDFASKYFTVIMAASIPGSALASRLMFRRARYNYAEHLIFNTYVGAQQSLLLVVLLALTLVPGLAGYSQPVSFALASAFYLWAAVGFFGGPPISTVARALVATMLNFVGTLLLIMVAAILAIAAVRLGA